MTKAPALFHLIRVADTSTSGFLFRVGLVEWSLPQRVGKMTHVTFRCGRTRKQAPRVVVTQVQALYHGTEEAKAHGH